MDTNKTYHDVDASILPCGILILDEKNSIVEANSMLCRWLDCERQQILSHNIKTFFSSASNLLYLSHILPLLQTTGLVEEKYLTLKNATGDEVPVLFNAVKTTEAGNIQFVFSFLKMSRRNLIEEKLIIERRKAVVANQEKDTLNRQLHQAQADLLAKQDELITTNESHCVVNDRFANGNF